MKGHYHIGGSRSKYSVERQKRTICLKNPKSNIQGRCHEEYEGFTREVKNSIRERDKFHCQNPYCSNGNIKRLHIHHIDWNKKNFSPNNLITLCSSCHGMAGKKARNGRFFRKIFSELMLKKRENRESLMKIAS